MISLWPIQTEFLNQIWGNHTLFKLRGFRIAIVRFQNILVNKIKFECYEGYQLKSLLKIMGKKISAKIEEINKVHRGRFSYSLSPTQPCDTAFVKGLAWARKPEAFPCYFLIHHTALVFFFFSLAVAVLIRGVAFRSGPEEMNLDIHGMFSGPWIQKVPQVILMNSMFWTSLIYICVFYASMPNLNHSVFILSLLWLWFHNKDRMKCVGDGEGCSNVEIMEIVLYVHLVSFPLWKWGELTQRVKDGKLFKSCFLKNIFPSQIP